MKSASCQSGVGQSFALQLIYPEQSGVFAEIAQTIGRHGGDLGHIDLLGPVARLTTRGISIRVRDEQHLEKIVAAVRTLDKVKVVEITTGGVSNSAANRKTLRERAVRVRRGAKKTTRVRPSRKSVRIHTL